MFGMAAMAEVQAEQVNARPQQLFHLERAIAGRPERGEDLGAAAERRGHGKVSRRFARTLSGSRPGGRAVTPFLQVKFWQR